MLERKLKKKLFFPFEGKITGSTYNNNPNNTVAFFFQIFPLQFHWASNSFTVPL